MRRIVFTAILTAIFVCVAYDWVSDWYHELKIDNISIGSNYLSGDAEDEGVFNSSRLKVDNSLIFRSGGKEHEIDCDDSTINRQNWPECWSMPSSGWHINLCVGDEVIYTFR